MTYEEAIKYGEEQLEVFGGTHAEFIELSIEALERQTHMKPNITERHPHFLALCPYCGKKLIPSRHCSSCGQAIDWSEEE